MERKFPVLWDGYVLLDHLDSGGMAEIFLAMHAPHSGVASQRLLAIKRIRQSYREVPEWVAMFKNEIQVLTSLQSPHIVQTYGFSVDSDEPYIVMEYVEGLSLNRVFDDFMLRGQKVDAAVLVEIFAQVAEGLQIAHAHLDPFTQTQKPVIHRDMSPQNILLGSNGFAKIIDFGIAKFLSARQQTQVTQIKGKPSYMSPEQLRADARIDARTDIFSLGICFWELLTMRKLFDHEDESIYSIVKKYEDAAFAIEDPRKFNADLDPELGRIVLKMLKKNPEERYGSIRGVVQELRAFQKEKGLSAGAGEIASFLNRQYADVLAQRKMKVKQALDVARRARAFDPITAVTIVVPRSFWGRVKYRSKQHAALLLAVSGVCFLFGTWLYREKVPLAESASPTRGLAAAADGERRGGGVFPPEIAESIRAFYLQKFSAASRLSPKVAQELDDACNGGSAPMDRAQAFIQLSYESKKQVLRDAKAALDEIFKSDEAQALELIHKNTKLFQSLPPPRRPRNNNS